MASTVDTYVKETQGEPEKTSVDFPSGEIVLVESCGIDEPRCLDKQVAPGTYGVDIYRLSDERMQGYDAEPTCGISAMVVHFSDRAIATWQEVETEAGESPVDSGNLIDFVLTDEASLASVSDEVESLLEDCHTDGFGTTEEESALVCYIGEVALEHKLHWGLDAEGNVVKLFGFFTYPDEGQELDDGSDVSGKKVQFTVEDIGYQVTIPGSIEGRVEIDVCDSEVTIKVGKEFHLEACMLVFSEPDPEKNYLQKQKTKFTENGVLQEMVLEEDNFILFKSQERGEVDYRLIWVAKAGSEYFGLREYPPSRPEPPRKFRRAVYASPATAAGVLLS